jgi:hypothetical protein
VFHGEADGVCNFGILMSEKVRANNEVSGLVDQDIGCPGCFADAVVLVPAIGIGETHIDVDSYFDPGGEYATARLCRMASGLATRESTEW